MFTDPQNTVSVLMNAFRAGDSEAGAKLTELFYPELKRLAASHLMRERQGHSWQPTILVNELYLELTKIKALRPSAAAYDDDRAAFFALAGLLMRRLLIHHARPLSRKAVKVPLWDEMCANPEGNLLEIEDLLQHLENINPVIRTVVEKKVFEGHTAEEIARQMGCSAVTVNRHWQFARHWMKSKF
ncbi:ECF-type sigma factor [Paludibaculum fermentans]|uniref:RNA polymerase subunit sigma n=1 Tax=Paludibaculum fermentans TaxID=1473598 RepID=A0A7S7NV91_PALFE|nr:ECF-type sigma factor [Paludibaculum fermentans]QOY90358.1 RNA polymerase subunit sigma [Paludibaculum fermentans]